MATRRNRKSRKNYKKSRKNYKRVRRGGQASNYEPRLAEYNIGSSTFTKSPGYQNMINMRDYDKNSKNAQRNLIQLGIQKDQLSQLTDLNAFQRLDPDQQKALVKTFMSLTPVEQDEYIKERKEFEKGLRALELKRKIEKSKLITNMFLSSLISKPNSNDIKLSDLQFPEDI
jgi:hypothetical protein